MFDPPWSGAVRRRQNRLLAALPADEFARLHPQVLKDEFYRPGPRQNLLLHYAQALLSEGVTEAAGRLHKAGLIEYHRGHITVCDRPGLEARVCECYAVVKKEFDRLLPGKAPR